MFFNLVYLTEVEILMSHFVSVEILASYEHVTCLYLIYLFRFCNKVSLMEEKRRHLVNNGTFYQYLLDYAVVESFL